MICPPAATLFDTTAHHPRVSPNMSDEAVLSVDELCKRLSISRSTFYRLRREGKIPPPTVKRFKPACIWPAGVVQSISERLATR